MRNAGHNSRLINMWVSNYKLTLSFLLNVNKKCSKEIFTIKYLITKILFKSNSKFYCFNAYTGV